MVYGGSNVVFAAPNANWSSSTASGEESGSYTSVADLLSFLRDVQKFLVRLNHEAVSEDSREIQRSLEARIEFYTRRPPRSCSSHSLARASLELSASALAVVPDNHRYSAAASEADIPRQLQLQPPAPPVPARSLGLSSMSIDTSQEESSYSNYTDSDTDYSSARPGNSSNNNNSFQLPTPDSPPAKTSTPRKVRNSGIFTQMNQTAGESIEEEAEEEDDEYDLVEIRAKAPAPELDMSARGLVDTAAHKGWLWKKESLFKSVRYWALVHLGSLYLYADVKDEVYKECYPLEGARLKRHKKGVKFLLEVAGTYKNKNCKQEYQTESRDMTDVWMMHLENGIANAGRTPKTTKKLSIVSKGENIFLDIYLFSTRGMID